MTKKYYPRGDTGIELLVSLALLALALVIYLVIASWSCSSKWSESGFVTKWGPIAGCRISSDGKRYIPEERYREIADE